MFKITRDLKIYPKNEQQCGECPWRNRGSGVCEAFIFVSRDSAGRWGVGDGYRLEQCKDAEERAHKP